MKITKYEHACIALEEQGKRLVIDPGGFTPEFGGCENIEALVVTHVHADHFDPQHVKDIVAANPEVKIYTVQEVADELKGQNVIYPRLATPAPTVGWKLRPRKTRLSFCTCGPVNQSRSKRVSS